MSLLPNDKFDGLYYKSGSVPQSCSIYLTASNPKIQSSTIVNGLISVFIKSRRDTQTTYSLGTWNAESGNLSRPKAPFPEESMTLLEASALSRLHVVLQRHSAVEVAIDTASGSFQGHCVPLEFATASPIFRTKINSSAQLEPESQVTLRTSVNGMLFAFETRLLAASDRELVFKLPDSTYRQVRRTVPRKAATNFQIRINQALTKHRVLDFSPTGICFECLSDEIPKQWEEISISLGSDSEEESAQALVMSTDGTKVRAIIGAGQSRHKDFFYKIWNQMEENLEFSENPLESWTCLRDFGYLDLLEGGLLRNVEEACLNAWESTKNSPSVFHPVVHVDRKICGTIAAAEVTEDHWVPHSLATKVDPTLVDVSAALYIGWPLYLLSQSRPLWFSTWYDANKKWHNRFYQVFIREQKNNPDCFTFVRHWFWNADLKRIPSANNISTQVLVKSNSSDAAAASVWQNRYGDQCLRIPAIALRTTEYFAFKETAVSFFKGENVVAIGKVVTSALEINPFSVLNCIHLNIFGEKTINQQHEVLDIITAANNFMAACGLKRCALTLDYDTPPNFATDLGYNYFSEIRCLTSQSDLLPSLMSNNALSFADIKTRA